VEWLTEFTTWASSTFVGSLADIVPGWGYVQNSVDIYEAFKHSVFSCIDWFKHSYSGIGVDLLEGEPTLIAKALERHHMAGLAGGLKDIALTTLKTGLSIAGDAAAGMGSMIGVISGILQRIANLIGYCTQRFLLNKVINQASYQHRNSLLEPTHINQFNHWFKKSIIYTPIISALAINSGFIAHPYRFLSLLKENDKLIDSKSFNEGIKHIEQLKEMSVKYIKEYQEAYKIEFRSDDKLVSNRLKDVLK
jgi:hypothetical protein